MPSPFDASAAKTLASAFARFGDPAIYLSPELATSACRIIINRADETTTLGKVPIVAGQTLVEVRASELSAPAKGGIFTADGRDFKIISAPKREDPSGLVWTCLCDLQPAL